MSVRNYIHAHKRGIISDDHLGREIIAALCNGESVDLKDIDHKILDESLLYINELRSIIERRVETVTIGNPTQFPLDLEKLSNAESVIMRYHNRSYHKQCSE